MPITNIAQTLVDMAEKTPDLPAVVFTTGYQKNGQALYTSLTYDELNQLCDRYAHGLTGFGIHLGERVLLMVRPGIQLIGITFALIKIGAVPVIIDPGMKRSAFLRCVLDTQPTAFIGIPKAHVLRWLYPSAFKKIVHPVVVGPHGLFTAPSLDSLCSDGSRSFIPARLNNDSEVAVAFTSGGTGIPKGVLFRMGMFLSQMKLLREEIGIQPGEVDLPGLYSFALFGPALGINEVFPDMDPSHPATVDAGKLVQSILDHQVTNSFGSPVIWRRIAEHCLPRKIQLPSIRRILMAGAPVPPSLIEAYTKILPNGEIYTPYGATEALPLTMISGSEILSDTAKLSEQGAGMCVGRPVTGVTIKVIKITDEAILSWNSDLELPQGDIGEIAAKGPMVTREYLNRPEQTAMAKIFEGDSVWHRMGDLGYFDEQGRLWFCGRKTHRVETREGLMLPVPCEAIFNLHPRVYRSALVGVGKKNEQVPVLVVEPKAGAHPKGKGAVTLFTQELLDLGVLHSQTKKIQKILFYPGGFPVDVRHNAKIDRLALGQWAAQQLFNR